MRCGVEGCCREEVDEMEGRNEAGWWKEGKNQTDSTGCEERGDTVTPARAKPSSVL